MADRLVAIGDIHGHLRGFDCLLDIIQPDHDDIVVTLGDIVDRGPDSCGVIERMIQIKDSFNLIPLRGNHEIMFEYFLKNQHADPEWLECGGAQTLASFGMDPLNPDITLVSPEVLDFLKEELVPLFEHEHTICVHAGLAPIKNLLFQPDEDLYWKKLDPEEPPHPSGKIVVCGHTRQKSGLPLWLGHRLCLDTNVYDGGWLTACDLNSFEYWQVNSEGTTRKGELEIKGLLKNIPIRR